MRIGFQGVKGAYSELAAREYFSSKRLTLVPHKDFAAVFRAVQSEKVRYGVLPIENSLAGSIHQNYDLLLKHKLWILGEVKVRIKHNLLVVAGTKQKDLKRVYSHPQALSQCEGYIRKMRRIEPTPYFDTAAAAQYIFDNDIKDGAAIASSMAAEEYGLKVLKSSIEDNPHNLTRFVILGKKKSLPKGVNNKAKTSIVFALKDIPGGLHKALSVFAIRDIDLVKIESRPIPGSPWKYIFYLDFRGSLAEERCKKALDHLGEISKLHRVLGSYIAG